MGKVKKMQDGGKSSLCMKSVKAGFDKNPGVTRADIIVAAKKQAKSGAKMKKAKTGATLKAKGVTPANVSKRLGSRLRAGGTLSPTGSNVSRKLSSPFKKKARGGATLAPKGTSTSNRLASNLKLKGGGSMKKCRGGCY